MEQDERTKLIADIERAIGAAKLPTPFEARVFEMFSHMDASLGAIHNYQIALNQHFIELRHDLVPSSAPKPLKPRARKKAKAKK